MSDIGVGAEAPVVEAPVVEATPVEAPVEDIGERFAKLLEGDGEFTVKRSEFRKFAELRDRMRDADRTFSAMSDGDRQAIMEFSGALASRDPARIREAAKWMRDALEPLTAEEKAVVQEVVKEQLAETNGAEALTPEKVREMMRAEIEARDSAAAERVTQQQAVAEVLSLAATEGKRVGLPELGDAGHPLHSLLLLEAKALKEGDTATRIRMAADKIAKTIAAEAQKMLKAKTPGSGSPVTPDGVAPGTAKPQPARGPRDFRGAVRAGSALAAERLRATPGN